MRFFSVCVTYKHIYLMQVVYFLPNSVGSFFRFDVTNAITKSENVYHLNNKNNTRFGNKRKAMSFKIWNFAFITLMLSSNLLFVMPVEYFLTDCVTIISFSGSSLAHEFFFKNSTSCSFDSTTSVKRMKKVKRKKFERLLIQIGFWFPFTMYH